MTDALSDFAAIAAAAIADIATGTLVDALASLEHALPSLHREQRYAGQALARALHALAGGQPVSTREPLDECVYWMRAAARWASYERSRANDMEAGCCIERAQTVAAVLPGDELRALVRVVVGEVRRLIVAEACHVAA